MIFLSAKRDFAFLNAQIWRKIKFHVSMSKLCSNCSELITQWGKSTLETRSEELVICKHDFSFQREQINLAKNQILCFHAKMVLELFRIDYLVWLEHKLKLIHHFCSEHSNIRGPPHRAGKRPSCDLNLCTAT